MCSPVNPGEFFRTELLWNTLRGLFLKEIGIAALVKFCVESAKYVTVFVFLNRKRYKKR